MEQKINKNYIILALIILLVISLFFNFQKSDKITEDDQSQIDNEALFQKKQDCQKYKTEIEQKLESLNFSNPSTNYQSVNILKEIFFSPKANSCLYIAEEWGWENGKIRWETVTLEDALTSEVISSSLREMGSEDYLSQKTAFNNLIEDYKK
jgi:hypothetical protein